MQPYLEIDTTMASTRLQRKERKNRLVAKKKNQAIQRLNTKPVIKNVDVDKIKEEFEKGNINRPVEFKESTKTKPAKAKPAKTEAKKAEKSASAEAKVSTKKEAKPAKTEAKPAKTEAKKAEPKTEKAESKKAAKAESKKEEAATSEGVDVDALLKSIGKAKESDKDDLKEINGIGPAFEKKLNEIGLYTYEQISKLKKNDIENLGKLEGLSADKIESDNWVESAKALKQANKGE